MAADLVNRKIAVIATVGGTVSALAAKAATAAIPIVFISDQDPVKVGLVKNLNRPDGNATGVSQFTSELEAKRLALLRELIPSARRIAILVNTRGPIPMPIDRQEKGNPDQGDNPAIRTLRSNLMNQGAL